MLGSRMDVWASAADLRDPCQLRPPMRAGSGADPYPHFERHVATPSLLRCLDIAATIRHQLHDVQRQHRSIEIWTIGRYLQSHRIGLICSFHNERGFAAYDGGSNVFACAAQDFPANNAGISLLLHEAVHAIVDLEFPGLTRQDNETLAYTVQMMSLILACESDFSTATPDLAKRLSTNVFNHCFTRREEPACLQRITAGSLEIATAIFVRRTPSTAAMKGCVHG